MTDIATLGLKFESSDAERGAVNLDKLVAASKRAETAVDSTSATAERSFRKIGDGSRTIDRLNASLEREAALTREAQRAFEPFALGIDRLDASIGRVGNDMSGLRNQIVGVTTVLGAQLDATERLIQAHERLGRRTFPASPEPSSGGPRPSPWGSASLGPTNAIGIPLIPMVSREAREEIEKTTAANDNLTKSVGLQRHEWINLGRQMQDVGTMALMGASPFQILASQGAQVYDVLSTSQGGVRGALKEVGSTMLGLVTPGRLAFASIAGGAGLAAAALTRAADQANEVNKALRIGAGLRSGMAAGDIEALSHVPNLSRGEGRAAALAYGGAGASRANTAAALGLTHGLADLMYEGDVRGAQKGLSDAMRGGTASLLKYVDGIRPLSTATSDWIERIRATQGEQAANTELLRLLNDGIRAAGIEVPLWRQALTRLGNTASDLADDFLKEAANRANTTVREVQSLTQGRNDIGGNTAREMEAIWQFFDGLGRLNESMRQRFSAADGPYGAPQTRRPGSLNVPLPPDASSAIASSIANLEAERARGVAGTKEVRGLNGVYNTDAEALRRLNDELAAYDRLLKDTAVTSQMSTAELRAASLGRDRLAAAVKNFMGVERQAEQAFELSRQSIGAYTADQKLAAIQAQRFAEVSRDKTRAHLAEAEAQRAVTLETDRWTAAAKESLRTAQDQYKTAGMLPWKKQMADLAIERDRNILQFGDRGGLFDSIYRTKVATAEREASGGALNQTTLSIREQVDALKVQRDSMFATDEQAATLAARQQLLNDAYRQGIPPAKLYAGQLDDLAAQMGKVSAANAEFQRIKQNVVEGLDEQRAGTRSALTGFIGDVARGKDPRQGLLNAAWRSSDQLVDRLVSKPITEGLLGRDGTGQDGLFGGLLGQMFGSSRQTANMAVNAAVVNIGGVGLGSLTNSFGLGGSSEPGAAIPAASQATQGNGGLLGWLGLGGAAAASAGTTIGGRTIVRDDSGRILSYSTGGSGGLPVTVNPSGVEAPQGAAAFGGAGAISSGIGAMAGAFGLGGSSLSGRSAYDILGATIDARARPDTAMNRLEDQVRERDASRFGPDADPSLIASMGPSLLKQAEAMRSAMATTTDATGALGGAASSAASNVGDLATTLTKALGNVGSGGFSFGIGSAAAASSGIGSVAAGGDWFASGGYTGPGGRYEPAGVVHRGEVVWSQADVARHGGPYVVDAMRLGLRGYDVGGPVELIAPQPVPMPPMHASLPMTAPANSNVGPVTYAPVINMTPAEGVTPAQLQAVLERHGAAMMKEISRKAGPMYQEWVQRYQR